MNRDYYGVYDLNGTDRVYKLINGETGVRSVKGTYPSEPPKYRYLNALAAERVKELVPEDQVEIHKHLADVGNRDLPLHIRRMHYDVALDLIWQWDHKSAAYQILKNGIIGKD